MKRCKFEVYGLPNNHVARFSDYDMAIAFARMASRPNAVTKIKAMAFVSVTDNLGVIAPVLWRNRHRRNPRAGPPMGEDR